MFYLETKDGERFFTDANSDDKQEFEKIVESKMGREASDMFSTFVSEAYERGEEDAQGEVCEQYTKIARQVDKLKSILKQVTISLNEPEINKDDIRVYLEALDGTLYALNDI